MKKAARRNGRKNFDVTAPNPRIWLSSPLPRILNIF